ncbi:unnamed protein product [Triticum turgidum subsp. durum]|uniref:4-coumarate--CoA ligase n=1 Tax=Triticum turgidum subsp. durum TaxID=4567 RepID=A0A9R0U5H2_TRITD|nr:unnamed protein product [Triticum turgidum subsp. durum]
MEGSVKCDANYTPLTPLSFLERAALVYGARTAVVFGEKEYSWRDTRERCLAGASALARLGVGRRDVVAVLAANTPAMYELHFSVPMTGGVLCTLNTRHDAAMVSVLLNHSEARVFLVESQFLGVARDALALLADAGGSLPLLVTIADGDGISSDGVPEYEALLRSAPRGFEIRWPADECDPISLNYTSGTTSRPKGVIYSHRGAYLNTLATALANEMPTMPVYLWAVPMFHCNGWCMVWATAAQGGTSVCMAGSLAPKAVFEHVMLEGLEIKDPATMVSVPSDGRTVGEVMLRGNTVMSGYYKDPAATAEAMSGGWLRSGDLGVRHPDGYIQLKDRSKDIIISGGENISSIEVESALFGHPAVLDAAVVARPDEHWGETPCAFVTLKDGASATEADIIEFCRARLPRYMAPKTVIFAELPKTSTGKTQKYLLRDKARAMGILPKLTTSKL